ncbi:MAG: glutamate--tRNA ligase [Thermoanaerobaculia bacterium]
MKLRFAPSPTGFLHVGGARTAIFNLLHARHHGGTMLLRIEDTDVERSKQHHAEQIVSSLRWLGVEWDEGPVYQSDRLARYREQADLLVAKGLAYRCYCTVDELEAERTAAEKAEIPYRYSGRCRENTGPEAVDSERSHVVRFRVPPDPIEFHDLIRGDVHFAGELIDDFVLLRSDGNPTYHLSVVVDDIDMDVTHVARGDDHLSNTPKHIVLFKALGASVPVFAHLPLILGGDRKRLSKRTGATSAEEYRDMGILPQALFNFLMLLGWNPGHGDEREVMTVAEAAAIFDLSDVNKAPAVFDPEKLLWMNGQYLIRMSAEEILPHLLPFFGEAAPPEAALLPLVALNKTRARTLKELAHQLEPFLADDDAIGYEDEAVRKHLKGEGLSSRLQELAGVLAAVEPFDVGTTEHALRELAERQGVSAAKLIHPLRLALTGRGASPPVFDVAVVLGRERTLSRLNRLVARLPELMPPQA